LLHNNPARLWRIIFWLIGGEILIDDLLVKLICFGAPLGDLLIERAVENLPAGGRPAKAAGARSCFLRPAPWTHNARGFGAVLGGIDRGLIASHEKIVERIFHVRRGILSIEQATIVGFIFAKQQLWVVFTVEPA
jgi:hypothetical protein